jgi:iron complex transport system ATP-binding protein
MLKIKNIYSGYGKTDIIKDISIDAVNGEVLCIVGPNGCGKSTLLKALINILPYRGSILIDDKEVSAFSRKTLAAKIALMAQAEHVYFPYTVQETISLGRYAYSEGVFNPLSKKDNEIVLDIMNRLKLDDVRSKLISELSGGQLQRVFLARTLAQTPDIILLDEPTNHLDLTHQIDLLDLLKKWVKENNKIVIAVLHDLNLVQNYADNAAIMDKGKVVLYGKANKIFNGGILKEVYDMDIRRFMLDSLAKWSQN